MKTGAMIGLVLGVLGSPALARAVDGTAGNDTLCLYRSVDDAQNRYCLNDGSPVDVGGSFTFNALGGNDRVVVYSSSACTCVCTNEPDAVTDFSYAGGVTVTINGGSGTDAIVGGSGTDTIDGGTDGDFVAGAGGEDWVSGYDGNDTVRDAAPGAASIHMWGGDDNDCVQPINGCLAAIGDCDCGSGTDYTTCAYCDNCEYTTGSCSMSCPSWW